MQHIGASARVIAETASSSGQIPTFVFGLVGFGVLAALLVITLMLKVER